MVRRILKKTKRKPAYKRGQTIFQALRNVKEKYSAEKNSGIYRIPLENIDESRTEVYIGATTRNLKDRIQEHKRDIGQGNVQTGI